MAHQDDLIAEDIVAYLKAHENKGLLRFITCGSVDDGKSTLIGRMLYESKLVFEDQLATLAADSKKVGTQGDDIDFALLVDGLSAEREQGITIDVAYRFFSTKQRKFIVADTPGHAQYTRNMATGASTADVAILLIDARHTHGVLTQTRRHSFIASMLGVRTVLLAINKMDLVDYGQARFDAIVAEYMAFAEALDLPNIVAIPVSALKGDNVTNPSQNMPWYTGPTLIEFLETVELLDEDPQAPFRMPVQWVNRPNLDFRGFCGTVAGGRIRPGDPVLSMPSGKASTVKAIVTYDGDLDEAICGQSVTLTLNDEIDASRGDVLVEADRPCEVADQFQSRILWMADDPMVPGRPYVLKSAAREVQATITRLKHRVDVNTLERQPAKSLGLNEIAVCNLSLAQPLAFDAYTANKTTGGFILIDRLTNNTVGMGMLDFPLRRASNLHWQSMDVDKAARGALKGQTPLVLWFTGRPGAGKSTTANLLEKRLHARAKHTILLDGENVRHGLSRDLGFTEADRVENIRRVSQVAKLMLDAGLITLISAISPFESERLMARETVEAGEFVEVFIDCPIEVAEARDQTGMYAKARAGELKNFTGIDSAYEAPSAPEIRIDTATTNPEAAVEQIMAWLEARGLLG